MSDDSKRWLPTETATACMRVYRPWRQTNIPTLQYELISYYRHYTYTIYSLYVYIVCIHVYTHVHTTVCAHTCVYIYYTQVHVLLVCVVVCDVVCDGRECVLRRWRVIRFYGIFITWRETVSHQPMLRTKTSILNRFLNRFLQPF